MRQHFLMVTSVFIATAFIVLASCGESKPPRVESDNRRADYVYEARVEIDENVYEIRGEVVGDITSLSRQVAPGSGMIVGYGGFVSGSAIGPDFAGKGFARLHISSIKPANATASVGDVVILKTTDTKAVALVPGDVVTFLCRRDFEALAAVISEQEFDASEVGTWEFDFCRMVTPRIGNLR